MNYYFGVRETRNSKKNTQLIGASGASGGVAKPKKQQNLQTLYKRFRYLIYDSEDPDPTIRAKEESVYRRNFVYPGTNQAIEDPARHLLWYFNDDPSDPHSHVSNTSEDNGYYVTLARRTWKDPKNPSKTKKAKVVCVHYYGKNMTILYTGSTNPPTFYIEVSNPANYSEPTKLYGMIATSFTPPNSPRHSPRHSPVRSQGFGKRKNKLTKKQIDKDLKYLSKR